MVMICKLKATGHSSPSAGFASITSSAASRAPNRDKQAPSSTRENRKDVQKRPHHTIVDQVAIFAYIVKNRKDQATAPEPPYK